MTNFFTLRCHPGGRAVSAISESKTRATFTTDQTTFLTFFFLSRKLFLFLTLHGIGMGQLQMKSRTCCCDVKVRESGGKTYCTLFVSRQIVTTFVRVLSFCIFYLLLVFFQESLGPTRAMTHGGRRKEIKKQREKKERKKRERETVR